MKPTRWAAIASTLVWLWSASVHAAESAPPPVPEPLTEASAPAAEKTSNEPAVRRTVIDDSGAHIEELRVRGQLQKVTVDPKGGAPGYEILVGDGSRDLSSGANTSRGATGKRVWNVFRF